MYYESIYSEWNLEKNKLNTDEDSVDIIKKKSAIKLTNKYYKANNLRNNDGRYNCKYNMYAFGRVPRFNHYYVVTMHVFIFQLYSL